MKRTLSFILSLALCLSLLGAAAGGVLADGTVTSAQIVAEAAALLGKYPYVTGGESPEEGGFDCSGLVYYVYSTRLGLPMTIEEARTRSKLLALGTKITGIPNFLPGDIVQFSYEHVAIYIGDNTIIEASKPGTYIRTRSIAGDADVAYAIRLPYVLQTGAPAVTDTPAPTAAPGAAASPAETATGGAAYPATTPAPTPAPSAAPSGPVRVSTERKVYGTRETVAFQWEAASGAAGYHVSLLRGGTEYLRGGADVGTATTYSVAGLPAGEYTFIVRAIYGSSASCDFLVTDEVPGGVTGLASDKTAYAVGERPSFHWDAASGAENYRVTLRKDAELLHEVELGAATTYSFASLPAGSYTLSVSAFNVNGYGESGAACSFTVGMPAAAEPAEAGVPAGAETGAPVDTAAAEQYYIVRPGDTLESISRQFYGSGDYAELLYEFNRDGHFLESGGSLETYRALRLPAAERLEALLAVGEDEPAEEAAGVHLDKIFTYLEGQFADVLAEAWYAPGVASAYELGLMKGDGDGFNPGGSVTLAQAVTMAARLHSLYATGAEDFDQSSGGAWYRTYLDYALEHGIVGAAFPTGDMDRAATRAEFAEIFANALPAEALAAINGVADGAIPDLSASDGFAGAVYLLYRAGVLTGGEGGAFSPGSGITRAEAAAIVSRMAESNNRKSFTLG